MSRRVGELTAVVLAGGLAYEREVSLHSGRRVCEALKQAGVAVRMLDPDGELLAGLAVDRPDAVFIALHGADGEDGALRSVLDLADVPYVGSDAAACRMAWDKPTAKAIVHAAGLTTPAWVALPHSTFRELGAAVVLDRIVERFGLPLMVKPAQGGSALGARVIRSAAELPAAMVSCLSYGDTVLLEPYVEGVEVSVSVVDLGAGPVALPAVEIVPTSGVFDYAARYTPGATEYFAPARLGADLTAAGDEAARRTFEAVGVRDVARADLIVDAAGTAWVIDLNISPGMTDTSLLPMSAAAVGISFDELCERVLRAALARSGAVANRG